MNLDEGEVTVLYSFKRSLLNKRKSRNKERKGKEEGEREKMKTAWSCSTAKGKNSSLRTSFKIRCIEVILPPS